jgi:hypothetical protein
MFTLSRTTSFGKLRFVAYDNDCPADHQIRLIAIED